MMKFESTESMSLTDAITQVSKEIVTEYPSIDATLSTKIAALCNDVSWRKTDEEVFRRYYHILYIIGKEHPAYYQVFKDMFGCKFENIDNPVYQQVYDDIVKYVRGEISVFPVLSEYYQN